jgi:hypothetical protein
MKEEKAKHKIQILGDNHARGLANEFKYKLTRNYEIQGVIKPGSTLVNLVNTTPSDLNTLSKSDVCIVWGDKMMLREMKLIWELSHLTKL